MRLLWRGLAAARFGTSGLHIGVGRRQRSVVRDNNREGHCVRDDLPIKVRLHALLIILQKHDRDGACDHRPNGFRPRQIQFVRCVRQLLGKTGLRCCGVVLKPALTMFMGAKGCSSRLQLVQRRPLIIRTTLRGAHPHVQKELQRTAGYTSSDGPNITLVRRQQRR